MKKLLSFLVLLSPLALTNAQAQATEKAGTCRCCELGRIYAPYLKKLPAPKLRNNVGNSHIKITTKSAKAQQWFDQGVNLLHAFWEFEAYRCFLQAAKEDPDCAMAYWGICMSLPGKNPESANERTAALKKAKELSAKASEHEKLYVEVVDKLISSGSRVAVSKLKEIAKKHPEDADAQAWICLWTRDGYQPNGKPNKGTIEAIAILEKALKKHPMHTGLNHYMIHVLEMGSDFEKARSAALALPKAAPGAGHLVHMPGHIYYLAGEYEAACQAFRDCDKVETAYLKQDGIPAVDANNYLHNLHFLTYAAADQGRYHEALQAAATLSRVKMPAGRIKSVGAHIIHYYGSTATALVYIRARKFDLAAASLLPDSVPNNSGAQHYIRFLRSYCKLQHALRSGSADAALIQKEKLALTHHFKLFNAAKPAPSGETQPWGIARETCKILTNECRAWTANVPAKENFSSTWAGLAVRDYGRAGYTEPPLLVTPVEESLGWLALQTKHYAKAREYFQASLKNRRKCGHAYLGIARSYRQENNRADAMAYYKKFLTAFSQADAKLPELTEARDYCAAEQ